MNPWTFIISYVEPGYAELRLYVCYHPDDPKKEDKCCFESKKWFKSAQEAETYFKSLKLHEKTLEYMEQLCTDDYSSPWSKLDYVWTCRPFSEKKVWG